MAPSLASPGATAGAVMRRPPQPFALVGIGPQNKRHKKGAPLVMMGSAPFLVLAEWTGLEPATPGVTGRYSNQLNYHSLKSRLPNRPG